MINDTSSDRQVTTTLFLVMGNPFERHPRNGWHFSTRVTASPHEKITNPILEPRPEAKMAMDDPVAVHSFLKRLRQKFEQRWFQLSTVYNRPPQINHNL